MKNTLLLLVLITAKMMGGCKKDNKEEPTSILSGLVVVAGTKQPVGVATQGTQLELWQDGYQLRQKIAVHINQDGTFSSRLFDGVYKLVRLTGAPWANNTDTIIVNLKGSTDIQVPVNPFFTLSGENFTYNKTDTSITGVFSVNRLDASRTADRVSLHLGLTNFVDANNQIPIPGANNDIVPPATYLTAPTTMKIFLNPARYPAAGQAELRRQLSEMLQKGYVFVRAGVRTTGITQRFYTQVKQISLN
jgi:hypothetical protein